VQCFALVSKVYKQKLKEESEDHCEVLSVVTVTADRKKAHLLFHVFMTKSENFILERQVVTMSLFGLTFLKAHWLVIVLAVVAADDAAFVQETIGKEERLHFKNATLQRHYGRTAGVSSSNCSTLYFYLYCCCSRFHSEPLETCRVTEWYMYHIGWYMYHIGWYMYHIGWYMYHIGWYMYHIGWYRYHIGWYMYHIGWYRYHIGWYMYHIGWYMYHIGWYMHHIGWCVNSSIRIVSTVVVRNDRMCSETTCHCSRLYM